MQSLDLWLEAIKIKKEDNFSNKHNDIYIPGGEDADCGDGVVRSAVAPIQVLGGVQLIRSWTQEIL